MREDGDGNEVICGVTWGTSVPVQRPCRESNLGALGPPRTPVPGVEGRGMKSEAKKESERVLCMMNIEMGWLIWKERGAMERDAQEERTKMAPLKKGARERGRWEAT